MSANIINVFSVGNKLYSENFLQDLQYNYFHTLIYISLKRKIPEMCSCELEKTFKHIYENSTDQEKETFDSSVTDAFIELLNRVKNRNNDFDSNQI